MDSHAASRSDVFTLPPNVGPWHEQRSVCPLQPIYQANKSVFAITSLAEAHGYESGEDTIRTASDGTLIPRSSRKRYFPRAQRRFRDRLQLLDERLRLDVNSLKQEILDLQLQHRLIDTRHRVQRHARTDAAVRVVQECFEAFRSGIAGADDPKDLKGRQERFLADNMDENMRFGRYRDGITILMEQWRRYTLCHREFQVRLLHIDTSGAVSPTMPIVRADAMISGYITHETMSTVFPRVIELYPHLAALMVGALIEYPSLVTFHFNADGRISELDGEVDFVLPLAGVLGSLRDAALVLSASTIHEQCLIRSTSETTAKTRTRKPTS
ncbi:hypothetical protein Poli38472_000550 [Pythium oligandrum]|uniref:Uncharacterized protein n=1 Tax=Pythium oligandrum TaxID=41045 RepID=A0A8K1FJ88_PYTOL|nr:hypothetical protein Poli38472_000550 [Pythium oligandrum]|eukprot:TMW60508.1 hypothetical protein Poli38472_000550 [Pythium oligandrum]